MKENILQKIAKHLKMRFPATQISEDLGYSKSAISQFLNNKKEISEKFRKQFEEFYNVKFSDFEEENNILEETEPVYETGYDRKIAEAEKKIADLETKLTSNDPNLTPLAAEQIKDIITILYKEIKILSQAKISRMEDEMEDNK